MSQTKVVQTTVAVVALTFLVAACGGGQSAQSCSSDTQCGGGVCSELGCQNSNLTTTSTSLTVTPQTAQMATVTGVAPAGATFTIANPSTKGHGFAVDCDSDAKPSPEEGYLAPSAKVSVALELRAPPPGASTVTCTVTSHSGHTVYATFVLTLNSTGTSTADFSVAAQPTALTLAPGRSGTSRIVLGRMGGFSGHIALAISGVPSGAIAIIDNEDGSEQLNGSESQGSAALRVNAGTAAPGSYQLSINATSGPLVHHAPVALTISGTPPVAKPDFAVAASPGSISVVAGGAAAKSSISVMPANGFASAVTLTLAGLPAGATGTFDKTTLAGGTGSATLTVLPRTAASGKYPLTVTAAGGGLTHSATVDLLISTGAPAADFTLAATPGALSITDGGATATTKVSVTPSNGFARDVSLTVSGAPAGAKATLDTSTIFAGTGTATLSVQAMSAQAGSFTLMLTATGGTSTHTASVALSVAAAAPAPDFAFAASPTSLQMTAGASGTSVLQVSPMNGFKASVTLSVAGLPAGATASFTTPTLATGSGTDTLTVNSGTAAAGTYALTATASGGGVSHTAAIGLTIAAAACTKDTWVNFAQAFMVNNCAGCHSYANSVATLKPHQNAARISDGSMPPGGGLSASDKSRILLWLSCGLP